MAGHEFTGLIDDLSKYGQILGLGIGRSPVEGQINTAGVQLDLVADQLDAAAKASRGN